jgi:potassium efflux system protein
MILSFRHRFHISFCVAALFLALFCSFFEPLPLKAQEETAQTQTKESPPAPKGFPGRKEIIPKATAVANRLAEAHVLLQKAEGLSPVYKALDLGEERLRRLETLYSNWEEIESWRLNRLRMAESTYEALGKQWKAQFKIIQTKLQLLENLIEKWETEKDYWQGWQDFLRKKQVLYPEEVFERLLAGINQLLDLAIDKSGELSQAQLKYSPGQVTITTRLTLINKAMQSIRRGVFRRNSYSAFEPGFYRQYDRGLFSDFTSGLVVTLWSPDEYFKNQGWTLVLQLFFVLIIILLLYNRKKQSRPIAAEWRFIFQRPLAGAVFINIIIIGNFTALYQNLPQGWRWLLIIIMTVATIRLLNVIIQEPVKKKAAQVAAVIFMITESLQTFGMPEPILQIYNMLLCALAITLCLGLIRGKLAELPVRHFFPYLALGVAVIGLTAAMLGFERLASMLLHASLSTFMLVIILRISLLLVSGGIESFMGLEWIRNRKFMQVLGLEEGTRKLQTLAEIIILVNAVLILMVLWNVFDSFQDARNIIMGYEFTFGELTLSVKMVLLVVIILYLTTLFSWVLEAFVDSQIMTPRNMELGVKESLKRLLHYGLFTLGFLIAVSTAGLDLQKLTILVGALGVGIGFGLQNIVNNFVSGLILLFERPVKVGDIINIDQDWGTITRIGLRSTIFETFDNSEIIVPNADLVAQKVTNWTFTSKMTRIILPVGVVYGSPLEKVLEILNKAAKEHPEVLSNPAPNSIFEGFGNSSIDFKLRFWVRTIDERLRIRTEVAVIIDRLFREEDIEIAFPQLDLHLRSIDSDLQTLWGKESPKTRDNTEDAPE